jgi:AcrR family transcriptional regulator
MPKVSETYLNKKKDSIIEAACSVCKIKPLYQVTMKDIIKQAGISQGGIYRYFSDVDEILIEVINKNNPKGDYREKIDTIIKKNKTQKEALENLFNFLGNYMQENADTLGKFLFELSVMMSTEPLRGRMLQSKLKDGQSGQYFIQQMNQLILLGISTGNFRPVIPADNIMSFISISIDGIVFDGCLLEYYEVPQISEIPFHIPNLIETLKTSVMLLLSASNY